MLAKAISQRNVMLLNQRRAFSQLLVPLGSQAPAPAELTSTPLTDKYFADLAVEYKQFNDNCAVELQEMNKNVIENIVNRGGSVGWEHAEDNTSLKKSFEFSSFEQANDWIQRVAKRANFMDHHPEWTVTDGGRIVNVTLTSHFAGNTVSRLDFELAEALNEEWTKCGSTYKMFPTFTDAQWATIRIAAGCAAFGLFFFRFVTGSNYEQRAQKFAAIELATPHHHHVTTNSFSNASVPEIVAKQTDNKTLEHVISRNIQL